MERVRKKHDSHQSGTLRRVAQARSSRSSPQKDFASGIDNSPLMVAQRRKLQSLFGGAAQLREDLAPKPNNTGLPDNLKSGIESLSGMSMDHVKVHYNSSMPAQLNALAYAQGSDIHVAPGQEKHLPHEAWHVVQQAQGRVNPTMQMKGGVAVNDDKGLEQEADAMGARAVTQHYEALASWGRDRTSAQKRGPVVQLGGEKTKKRRLEESNGSDVNEPPKKKRRKNDDDNDNNKKKKKKKKKRKLSEDLKNVLTYEPEIQEIKIDHIMQGHGKNSTEKGKTKFNTDDENTITKMINDVFNSSKNYIENTIREGDRGEVIAEVWGKPSGYEHIGQTDGGVPLQYLHLFLIHVGEGKYFVGSAYPKEKKQTTPTPNQENQTRTEKGRFEDLDVNKWLSGKK